LEKRGQPRGRLLSQQSLVTAPPEEHLITISSERILVKHIVVFKYKSSVTDSQIEEVTRAFKALKGKIPGILSFEYGVNDSPENLNKGFTHVHLITFENAEARDAYLPHPEHKKFGELIRKLHVLEEALVLDFQPSE
jgi:Stress responsive A/B Barrel Domain